MRFFFSGELDAEVLELWRPVRKEIEQILNDIVGKNDYGDAIEKIAIIPMILSTRFAEGRKERRQIKHKEKIADYRISIDFFEFVSGDDKDRQCLLLENVLKCIEDIDRKLKGRFDGRRLACDITNQFPEILRK